MQSRYYDPEWGRFINADAFVSTGQGFLGNNMFAYCLNNPVLLYDPSGAVARISNQFCLARDDGCGGYVVSEDPLPYITDQSATGIGSQQLGLATVSHGGCGIVATYNALLTLGDQRSFDEVLSYYNSGGKIILWGYLGTLPHNVAQYFVDQGYSVYMTDDHDAIDLYSSVADASILWYT